MISSPGSHRAMMANAMIGLPPGVMTTWRGSTGIFAGSGVLRDRRGGVPGRPARRAVVGLVLVERPLGRLADVLRRVEVGLADFEMDNVHPWHSSALARQGSRTRSRFRAGSSARQVHSVLLLWPGRGWRAWPSWPQASSVAAGFFGLRLCAATVLWRLALAL